MTERSPLPNLWPGNCFGCAPHNRRGLRLKFVRAARGVRADCRLDAHLCGLEGIAHGGIVATLLDEAAAWALAADAQRLGFTTDMQIRFAKPVPVGEPLVVEAQIAEHSAKQARTVAVVSTPSGTVLAEALASWMLMSVPVAARLTGLPRGQVEAFLVAVARS